MLKFLDFVYLYYPSICPLLDHWSLSQHVWPQAGDTLGIYIYIYIYIYPFVHPMKWTLVSLYVWTASWKGTVPLGLGVSVKILGLRVAMEMDRLHWTTVATYVEREWVISRKGWDWDKLLWVMTKHTVMRDNACGLLNTSALHKETLIWAPPEPL